MEKYPGFKLLDRFVSEVVRLATVLLALFFIVGAFYGLMRWYFYLRHGKNYSEQLAFKIGARFSVIWALLVIFSGVIYAYAPNPSYFDQSASFWNQHSLDIGQYAFWTLILLFLPIFIFGMIGHFFESDE